METAPAIRVRDLRKTYVVRERDAGAAAALRSLVNRRTREVAAVDGISFELAAGEVVGFLGPNGAGKTTTLKMLSGLLHPSGGEVSVLGHAPSRREKDFLRQITLVMGQRNQLVWDIPAADSFELNRAIYRIPRPEFRQTLDELEALLELGPLMGKPVRTLSLGERMKCEIAAALLHRRYIGIELEEKYCDLARRRLAGVERYLATPRREPQREQRSMDGRPRRICALQGGPR